MGSWQCNKGGEAKSSGDMQGLDVTGLDHADQPFISPLLKWYLKGPPEKLPADRLGTGDVEHAAFVLVVVVPHRCSDLTVLVLLGEPAEVFNPDQSRALGNPSMDFPVPEDQLRTH